MKDIKHKSRDLRSPRYPNYRKEPIPRNILLKLYSIKNKKDFESSWRKKKNRLSFHFISFISKCETLSWLPYSNNGLKTVELYPDVLKENNCQHVILYTRKMSFKNEIKNIFFRKIKIRKFTEDNSIWDRQKESDHRFERSIMKEGIKGK